jgi:hypothetical protein
VARDHLVRPAVAGFLCGHVLAESPHQW